MSLIVQREDDLDFLSTEYADLYDAADATAFQHGVWLHRLYRDLAPARGARPVVVTVRRAPSRELVLVLPLVATGRVVRTLTFADLGVADYNLPVASRAVLDELAGDPGVVRGIGDALGPCDLLVVDRVPDSADAVTALLAGSHARRHRYDTHLVTLSRDPEEWRGTLDPRFVRHLERKYKRLRPKGERVLREVTDVAEVQPLMERMRAFRAARFAGRRAVDLVQDDVVFAFYCAVARDSVEHRGPGRLVVLEVGGEPVAITLDLVEPDGELYVLVGYDVERLRNYSLGLLIVDGIAQDAIRHGRSWLDLTVGDEGYKADFGARPRALHQVRLPRTLRGRAALARHDGELLARRVAKQGLAAWEGQRERRRTAREERSRTADAESRTAST
jgi:CelD/BcsL family acetyltransferase involved in cellulose biosynthesis